MGEGFPNYGEEKVKEEKVKEEKVKEEKVKEEKVKEEKVKEEKMKEEKKIVGNGNPIGESDPALQDRIKMREELGQILNKEQKKLTDRYNKKEEIADEEITRWVERLQEYLKAGGRLVFTGGVDYDTYEINSGPVKSLQVENGKIIVVYVQSPDSTTKEKEKKLLQSGEEKTDSVVLQDAFSPDFSFLCKEIE